MTIDFGKKTGAISLEKGQRVTIAKTPRILASVTFARKVDYDVYAVILLKDGTEKVCSTFGSQTQPTPTAEVLGVKHLGDVRRVCGAEVNTETLQIDLTDQIDKIAVAAYSAQSNGMGSFKLYKVSMKVDNQQGTTVTVDANQGNSKRTVYTCVPAIIHNTADGVVIEQVEMYSSPSSENRPSFLHKGYAGQGWLGKKVPVAVGDLVMDAGSRNTFK